MSRDNVKRVLVTAGNQAVLAAGSRATALALGQVGVFDAQTNLSIDANSTPRAFYLAVGIDSDGDGVVDSIKKSSGQEIQADQLRDYTFRPHTAAQTHKLNINYSGIEASKEYGIKVEMRNHRILRTQGVVQFTKTFAIVANNDSETDFAVQLRDAINLNDVNDFVEAVIVTNDSYTIVSDATSQDYAAGEEVTNEDDIAIMKADEANRSVSVQLKSQPLSSQSITNLNLKYFNFRETFLIASLVDGFTSSDNITEAQAMRLEEGSLAQIRQLEYHENGVASPYVLSDTTGTARELTYYATSGKFDQIDLIYGHVSQSGWKTYINDLQTTVAVPDDDTVTRNGLVAVLDAQFTAKGFDALADDAAGASTDDNVVEATEDETAATDGQG